MSRATLVMTLVRICMQSAALRNKAVFFMSCTFVLVITGIVYIIVSILFCKTNDRNCVGFDVCFCRLPIQIAVSAMIGKHQLWHICAPLAHVLISGQLIPMSIFAQYTPAEPSYTGMVIHQCIQETSAENNSSWWVSPPASSRWQWTQHSG